MYPFFLYPFTYTDFNLIIVVTISFIIISEKIHVICLFDIEYKS